MWSWKINYIGSAIVVFLILFSLFVQFVYHLNLKYKYRKYLLNINFSGGKNIKKILIKKNHQAIIVPGKNYFQSAVNIKKKTIRLKYEMLINSSVYDEINAVFIAYKYIIAKSQKQKLVSYEGSFNLINSICALGLLLTLAFGAWILVIIFGLIVFCISLVSYYQSLTLNKKAQAMSWEYFKIRAKKAEQQFIKSYLKYKKGHQLSDILIVFSAPIIAAYQLFRQWGKSG